MQGPRFPPGSEGDKQMLSTENRFLSSRVKLKSDDLIKALEFVENVEPLQIEATREEEKVPLFSNDFMPHRATSPTIYGQGKLYNPIPLALYPTQDGVEINSGNGEEHIDEEVDSDETNVSNKEQQTGNTCTNGGGNDLLGRCSTKCLSESSSEEVNVNDGIPNVELQDADFVENIKECEKYVVGIGKIASGIGTPLFMDKTTEEKSRRGYERVCVEVKFDCSFPNTLANRCNSSRMIKIDAEYDWLPSKCPSCLVFGHNKSNCPKEVKKASKKEVWLLSQLKILQRKRVCKKAQVVDSSTTQVFKRHDLTEVIERMIERPPVSNIRQGDIAKTIEYEKLKMCSDVAGLRCRSAIICTAVGGVKFKGEGERARQKSIEKKNDCREFGEGNPESRHRHRREGEDAIVGLKKKLVLLSSVVKEETFGVPDSSSVVEDPQLKLKRKESLIDTVARKESELEVVLGELEISRHRRTNSRSVKVQKSQAKRKMTGAGPPVGVGGGSSANIGKRPAITKVGHISSKPKLVGSMSGKTSQREPKRKSTKTDGSKSTTTESEEVEVPSKKRKVSSPPPATVEEVKDNVDNEDELLALEKRSRLAA
ncbi:hypothetical protein GIB67_019763 [Kingdonia uniflora]|uniref:Zinc knuckle CX2CX4HX4C n=1 Tax=Kingdonia uniflora TaxID=39325 RepID=A0A7J7MK44_9MAGN|nr:hypothetical protein GIB67_019763 [Kingdonia uniflora]